MKIKGVYSFLIFSCLTGSIFGQGTTFDVEYAQICLIDSIAPDTVVQFWRFTQANNPGEFQVDRTFDLSATYAPTGTVLPCCSCLTEATAMDGAGFGGEFFLLLLAEHYFHLPRTESGRRCFAPCCWFVINS